MVITVEKTTQTEIVICECQPISYGDQLRVNFKVNGHPQYYDVNNVSESVTRFIDAFGVSIGQAQKIRFAIERHLKAEVAKLYR